MADFVSVSAVPVDFRARDDDHPSAEDVVRRYRTLIEQLPLVVYVDALDKISSNIFTSRQIEPLLGYSVEEWATEADLFARLLHPEDRDRVLAAHEHTHTTHEPLSIEYRLIARDGRVVWLRDEGVVVLHELGRRIEQSVRPGDTAARLGGDEFAVVLTEPVTPEEAVVVAERLLKEVGRPLDSGSVPVYTSASIGIAFGSDDEALLKEAD